MSDPGTVQKNRREEILNEIDAFVDTSIAEMDANRLKQFKRNSDKIMRDSSRRMKKAVETRESARLPLEVPRG